MKHLEKELQKGYLSGLIQRYEAIQATSKYPMSIGGSTALILYGLEPYRCPNDLDIIIKVPEPDLNKDFYEGFAFSFTSDPGGFTLTMDNKEFHCDGLQELTKQIRNVMLINLFDLQESGSGGDVLSTKEGFKVDFFPVYHNVTESITFLGKKLNIQPAWTIINARLMYGLNHTHVKQTCEIVLNFNSWVNPFNEGLPF